MSALLCHWTIWTPTKHLLEKDYMEKDNMETAQKYRVLFLKNPGRSTLQQQEDSPGVMVKVLDCSLDVSEFKLQSCN